MNPGTLIGVAVACLALSGCLEGERPPLWTSYPDPVSQVPAVTVPAAPGGAGGAAAGGSTISGLSALGPPVATTTTTTQETVEVWGPPGTTITSRTIGGSPPGSGSAGWGSAGQPRYVFPRNDIRCDNVLRRCQVWSGPRGRYVFDRAATRGIYGP